MFHCVKNRKLFSSSLVLSVDFSVTALKTVQAMNHSMEVRARVAVVWESGPVAGHLKIKNGKVEALSIAKGTVSSDSFQSEGPEGSRLIIAVSEAHLDVGAHATRITVRTESHAFSFFARDVNAEWPIWIPEYGVAVTAADDDRDYGAIAGAIQAKGLQSEWQRIEAEPEESYEAACAANRDQMCPTWLGVGRDLRFFRLGYEPTVGYWGYVEPRYHSSDPAKISGEPRPHRISFCIGKGEGCEVVLSRRLEDGVLPIVNSIQKDGDVSYHLTSFATLERQPLSAEVVKGTEGRLAYPQTGGHMCTHEEHAALTGELFESLKKENEELVCCIRVIAKNDGATPKYAWFKALHGQWNHQPSESGYVAESGTLEADGLTIGINRINGRPMPQEEMAILMPPGGEVSMEMIIPHQPIAKQRASDLANLDIDQHLQACREFWRGKLQSAARIRVPEPAVDERIRAGLLHCDLVALGREPDGNVLATIGWYAPIGSESSPIIQFFEGMGWHHLAQRCIQFFLDDRQDKDGFIQTFGRYQLETGGALWTMGEHYRYTRDKDWVVRNKTKLLKSCDYLIQWRNRNKREELRGNGYGLQDGKVADPEDFFHSFMLNALSYLGVHRSAEMLAEIDPETSARLAAEAKAYREDIRTAFREATENAPVIPTGDGSWVPAAPPWTDYPGALALYAEGGNWATHGAFGSRDTLIGPLYLVIGECLEPDDQETIFLNRAHHELFTVRNAGLTQPYYCRHDYIHLRRGEVKAFLKTFYNQFTAIQDRETYTFWEHYHHVSQHKTHEEGWFLMQVRWMLWLEEGKTLKLLSAIPRRWLEDGKSIELDHVVSYFGKLKVKVESKLADKNTIEATVECEGDRQPEAVVVRVPHPEGKEAKSVEGGAYDPATESVRIEGFKGQARILVRY